MGGMPPLGYDVKNRKLAGLGLVSKRAVSRSSSRRRELLRLSKDLPHDWSEQRHVLGFAA